MAFYLDTADREAIGALWPTGVFRGVTTNPTVLADAGLAQADLPEFVDWLRSQGIHRCFVQVLGTSTDQMMESARWLQQLGEVVIKVPATAAGLTVAHTLVREGAQVLLTAVYHPVQGLMARDLGVHWVAPYLGRMADAGRDSVADLIGLQQAIGHGPTRIMVASLRALDDVAELAAAGVPDFTMNARLARAAVADDLTARAVAGFEAAAAAAARGD